MFSDTLKSLVTIGVVCCLAGCSSSIGNNKSYLLKYKKNLIEWYQDEIFPQPEDPEYEAKSKESKTRQRSVEAETYLPFIYENDMPYILTNHYDSRSPADSKIWKGDPLSIIINKVYLADNKETFSWFGDTAEIGVVVSVEDGKGSEPKNVLVSYEEGITDKIFLPISDLLAYHTEVYDDEPIQIKVTVFEFDQLENENLRKMLGTAAAIGSALSPAYAPAISAAAQVGDFLIKQNQDDVIAKFTFQLYPWDLQSARGRITGSNGVPRVSYGHYLIVNTPDANNEGSRLDASPRTVFADFGLVASEVGKNNASKDSKDDKCEPDRVVCEEQKRLRLWPTNPESSTKPSPLPWSYVVLTVAKTNSRNTDAIISRIHSLNQTASGIAKLDSLGVSRAIALGQQLDDLKSSLVLFTETDQFDQRKSDPASLQRMFDILESSDITDRDKATLSRKLADLLPPMTDHFKSTHGITEDKLKDKDNVRRWYEKIKGRLVYNPESRGYSCKKIEGTSDC